MRSFTLKLSGITLAIAIIGGLVFTLVFPDYYLQVLPFLLLFFYGTTWGIHSFLLKMSKKDPGKFTRSSMVISTFKLLLYSTLAVIYIIIERENAIPFVICLMLFYVVYTVFDVVEITKIMRSSGKR